MDLKENQKFRIKLICSAIEAGDLDLTNRLICEDISIKDADVDGNIPARSLYPTLLMVAIEVKQVEIAKLLLEKDANINHRIWDLNGGGKKNARDFAAIFGLTDIVELIDSKLPVLQQFFNAICDGKDKVVVTLLTKGSIDENTIVDQYGEQSFGNGGYSFLMIAIKYQRFAIAKFLISKEINLNFEHQEWDKTDPFSEPIMVESYNAKQLALQAGMTDIAKLIEEKLNQVKPIYSDSSENKEKKSNMCNRAEHKFNEVNNHHYNSSTDNQTEDPNDSRDKKSLQVSVDDHTQEDNHQKEKLKDNIKPSRTCRLL